MDRDGAKVALEDHELRRLLFPDLQLLELLRRADDVKKLAVAEVRSQHLVPHADRRVANVVVGRHPAEVRAREQSAPRVVPELMSEQKEER
jgi:hypothetical protein